ncbi:IclR family transcriptional regulator [Microbacterium sp. DT81.1]|uniref:IclR family transcriptional regulator n=1 Tax=Microbacterium sp. DT81.1 TaxID=3393413 RepID=UPI003CEBD117
MQLVNGVHQAGQVLHLFSASAPEWGAADVGRALGLSRSHAHRLLSTLAEIGLLERSGPGGRFRLSWACFGYGSVLRESDPLVVAGVPILRELRTMHGLDPMLAVWRRGAVFSLEPAATPTVTRLEFADCPAVGLVLISDLPDDELEALVASATPTTELPTQRELRDAVRHIRNGGVLRTLPTNDRNRRWLVAPVVTGESIVAALGVCTQRENFPEGQSDLIVLKRAAASLTRALQRNPAHARIHLPGPETTAPEPSPLVAAAEPPPPSART